MFSSPKSLVFGLLLSLSPISALPFGLSFSRRATLAYDAIVNFNEAVPSGITGELMLKYKPWLEVYNGCVPYPAVNAAGDVGQVPLLPPAGTSKPFLPLQRSKFNYLSSAGLATNSNNDCGHATGQVYARAKAYNGAYAIMYSWYMPKDSPSSGLGHRHDWENVVVWLSSASTSATVRGVAISAHGDYQKETAPPFDGSRPKIGYISIWPVNHQLIATDKKGGQQPLIAWESLTDAARGAIAGTDFGSATPSFRDDNFDSYLASAFI
jgi:hypothetical protein